MRACSLFATGSSTVGAAGGGTALGFAGGATGTKARDLGYVKSPAFTAFVMGIAFAWTGILVKSGGGSAVRVTLAFRWLSSFCVCAASAPPSSRSSLAAMSPAFFFVLARACCFSTCCRKNAIRAGSPLSCCVSARVPLSAVRAAVWVALPVVAKRPAVSGNSG